MFLIKKISNWFKQKDKGFLLLFSIVISSILLAIALTVTSISYNKISFSNSSQKSSEAFYAANLGMECALSYDLKSDGSSFGVVNQSGFAKCSDNDITRQISSNPQGPWEFTLLKLGPEGKACANVKVERDGDDTLVTSYGYDTYSQRAGCIQDGSAKKTERVVQVKAWSFAGGVPTTDDEFLVSVINTTPNFGSIVDGITIRCGGACSASYNPTEHPSITMTANANDGNTFDGWTTGPCAGSFDPVCTFNLDSNKLLTGGFRPNVITRHNLTLGKFFTSRTFGAVSTVQQPGIDCGTSCHTETVSMQSGTINAQALAVPGRHFAYWYGGTGNAISCTGSTNPSCSFGLDQDSSLMAFFGNKLTVSKNIPSAGLVRAVGLGNPINCGSVCDFVSFGPYSIEAVPEPGFNFVNWTGTACNNSTNRVCNFSLSAISQNIVANFASSTPSSYTLTVSKSGTGSGIVSNTTPFSPVISCGTNCSQAYDAGTFVTLRPNATYGTFGGWVGCNSQTGNDCNVTMNATKNVTATFNASATPTNYTVQAIANTGGSVSPSTRTVASGGTTTFTVTPNTGYTHGTVTSSNTSTCPLGTRVGNVYTTGAIMGNCSYTFGFNTVTPSNYVATGVVNAGGGTITPSTQNVTHGNTAQFTLIPNFGSILNSIQTSDSVNCPLGERSTGPSGTTIYTTGQILEDGCVYTFIFHHALIVEKNIGEAGTVVSSPSLINCGPNCGTYQLAHSVGNYTITATAVNNNYVFIGWDNCDSFFGNQCSVNLNSPKSVKANYKYVVKAVAGPNGTVSPASRQVFPGELASFSVFPVGGFQHGSVSNTDTLSCPPGQFNSSNSYSVGPVYGACTITFNFIEDNDTHNVQARANINVLGAGTVSPAIRYVEDGDTTTFAVVPASGYTHTNQPTSSNLVNCPLGYFSGNTYTTGVIRGNCIYEFNFKTTVSGVVSGSGGQISSNTSVTVPLGSTATFSAYPTQSNYTVGPVGSNDPVNCPHGSFSGNTYTTGAINRSGCVYTFTFVPFYSLVISFTGNTGGSVSSGFINLPTPPQGFSYGYNYNQISINGSGAHSFNFVSGTSFVLLANSTATSTFTGWSGSSCSGFGNCSITMNQNRSIFANFENN